MSLNKLTLLVLNYLAGKIIRVVNFAERKKSNKKKFYITTAIPYVNAAPHIGHALEFVQTDAIAR